MSQGLTVIMPVRNAARFLESALVSLQQQTRRDFVLHVWDDGSEDQSPAILNRWLPNRLPGQVIGTGRIGIGHALARLVESAPTELIARMDADDVCQPDRFDRQLVFMQRHTDVAVLGTQMQRCEGSTGRDLGRTTHPLHDAELRWAMRLRNPINHPTVMMRRPAVLACGNYRDLRPGQDDDLWLRIARHHRMANLPACLLTYREHDGSVTARRDNPAAEFRRRRMDDAKLVFPGLELNQAQRLTHLLTHPDQLDVTRADLSLLDDAAASLALVSGEPIDYFRHTTTLRQQRLNLQVRRLKSRPLLGRLWPMVRGAGRLSKLVRMGRGVTRETPTQGGAAWAGRG